MKRDLKGVKMADPSKVTEHIDRSWYEKGKALHPYDGVTEPIKADPKYDTNAQYSWSKAPRYEGEACEVGPLARVLVAYAYGKRILKPWWTARLRSSIFPLPPSFLYVGPDRRPRP
jgi:[NiFe] hydrogenase large subunit